MGTMIKKGDRLRCVDNRGASGRLEQGNYYTAAGDEFALLDEMVVNLVECPTYDTGFYTDRFTTAFEFPYVKAKDDAFAHQIGGSHYTDMPIQPIEFILKNNLGWSEGNAIAYISRWRKKGGLQDLRKAVDTLNKLISYEESISGTDTGTPT